MDKAKSKLILFALACVGSICACKPGPEVKVRGSVVYPDTWDGSKVRVASGRHWVLANGATYSTLDKGRFEVAEEHHAVTVFYDRNENGVIDPEIEPASQCEFGKEWECKLSVSRLVSVRKKLQKGTEEKSGKTVVLEAYNEKGELYEGASICSTIDQCVNAERGARETLKMSHCAADEDIELTVVTVSGKREVTLSRGDEMSVRAQLEASDGYVKIEVETSQTASRVLASTRSTEGDIIWSTTRSTEGDIIWSTEEGGVVDIGSNMVAIRIPEAEVAREGVAFVSVQLVHIERSSESDALLISEGLLRFYPEEML